MNLLMGIGIFILFLICLFAYTAMSKTRSTEMQTYYSNFKKKYEGECKVGFGLYQGGFFSPTYHIIIAVDQDQRVKEAAIASGNVFEREFKEAPEYLGLDVKQYWNAEEEATKKDAANYYMNQKEDLTGKQIALLRAIKSL